MARIHIGICLLSQLAVAGVGPIESAILATSGSISSSHGQVGFSIGEVQSLTINGGENAFDIGLLPRVKEEIVLDLNAGNENMTRLYPSPTSEKIYWVSAQIAEQVAIYSFDGTNLLHILKPGNAVDVSSLPTGNYILQLKNEKNELILSTKFVKL